MAACDGEGKDTLYNIQSRSVNTCLHSAKKHHSYYLKDAMHQIKDSPGNKTFRSFDAIFLISKTDSLLIFFVNTTV